MVEVVDMLKKEQTWCKYCRSVLQYSLQEDVLEGLFYVTCDGVECVRPCKYIRCPTCGNKVEVFE